MAGNKNSGFKIGKPRPASAGRKAGTPNKMTVAAKEAIEQVFDRMGGTDALLKFAQAEPNEFYTKIWTKILPKNIQAEIDFGKKPDLSINAFYGDPDGDA